jgi:hypothetical protein
MDRIEVIVDLEPSDEEPKMIWWATAPAIGNLTVLADSLRDLERLATEAIGSITQERGLPMPSVVFTLRNDTPASGSVDPQVRFDFDAPKAAALVTTPGAVEGEQQRVARVPVPA